MKFLCKCSFFDNEIHDFNTVLQKIIIVTILTTYMYLGNTIYSIYCLQVLL